VAKLCDFGSARSAVGLVGGGREYWGPKPSAGTAQAGTSPQANVRRGEHLRGCGDTNEDVKTVKGPQCGDPANHVRVQACDRITEGGQKRAVPFHLGPCPHFERVGAMLLLSAGHTP
jgi:hypothetical protein